MTTIRVSREQAQRSITEQSIPSTKAKQGFSALVITAFANQLDYAEWFLKAVVLMLKRTVGQDFLAHSAATTTSWSREATTRNYPWKCFEK